MDHSTAWWLLVGLLVIAELLTGTFYLLMLALGAIVGALCAHFGMGTSSQIVAAALLGSGAVLVCYLLRKRSPRRQPASSNRDVNMDVGETILIESWSPDGTTTVKYRGAQWTAIHRPGVTPSTGMHRVAELVGNRLLVDPL